MRGRHPRFTPLYSSAASEVDKGQEKGPPVMHQIEAEELPPAKCLANGVAAAQIAIAAQLAAGESMQRHGRKGVALTFRDFMEVLARLAPGCHPSCDKAFAFQKALLENVLPLAGRRTVASVEALMADPEVADLLGRRFARGFDHFGVVGQAEVVVRAEEQHFATAQDDAGFLGAVDFTEFAPEPRVLDAAEVFHQRALKRRADGSAIVGRRGHGEGGSASRRRPSTLVPGRGLQPTRTLNSGARTE